jgi:hypothetical protein
LDDLRLDRAPGGRIFVGANGQFSVFFNLAEVDNKQQLKP